MNYDNNDATPRGTWINGVYQNPYDDPAKLADYNTMKDKTWNDIQNHTNGYESGGGGGFFDFMEHVMDPIMNVAIKATPYLLAASVGDAAGLFGGLGGAGSGAGATAGAEAGSYLPGITGAELGSAPVAGGLADLAGGVGAGVGAGEAAAGLGAMPVVTISGAAGGGGLGGAGLAGLGAAGLGGAALSGLGGNPPAPDVDPNDPNIPKVNVPGTVPPPFLPSVTPGELGPAILPGLPSLPNPVQGTSPNSGTGLPGLPSGLAPLLNGLGSLLGGNVDHIKAQQDADWWKSQLDTLQGMYKPGTPEADLMEQKMRAKDAAAGRNSQYGVRATDLAANLADKRAGIMTSAGYQNMSNAYRNRSSQDLNGLFSAIGQGGGIGNMLNTGINGYNTIASLFGGGASTPAVNVTPPTR